MGPTASGKTRGRARARASACRSRSSASIRRRSIAAWTSAPPSPTRRRALACAHHLIDLIDPDQAYSAARFRADALAAIADIRARGRMPLLVGGTMLYFKALREGLVGSAAGGRRGARARSTRARRDEGLAGAACASSRASIPRPQRASSPTDAQRIQRALEVYRIIGPAAVGAARRAREAPADAGLVSHRAGSVATAPSCTADRRRASTRCSPPAWSTSSRGLRQRFRARRVDAVDALRRLPPGLASSSTATATAMRCATRGIAATRQLAKRQLTWLRSLDGDDLRRVRPASGRRRRRLAGRAGGLRLRLPTRRAYRRVAAVQ